MSENKPIHTIRVGGIKASIWENLSQGGNKFYTTTIVRTFKDEADQWRESNSYLPDDLPKLELASKKAFEYVHSIVPEKKAETFAEKVDKERAGTGAGKKTSGAAPAQ